MPERFGKQLNGDEEKSFLENYKVQDKPEAMRAAEKEARIEEDSSVFSDRTKRVKSYVKRLENVFLNPDERVKERNIEMLKPLIHQNTSIREEDFPESYFDDQKRQQREMGMPAEDFTPEQKVAEIEQVQKAQAESLDNWIDYLSGEECEQYSSDVKFFVMQGVLKMGNYNREKKTYSKRISETTSPFPTINHLAVSRVMSALEATHHPKADQDTTEHSPAIQEFIDRGRQFGKIYEAALQEIQQEVGDREYEITDGEWVTFEQGSDPQKMVEFLQGKAEYICIAQSGHADRYLSKGDIHVYCSKDVDGQLKTARIAIASTQGRICELRGDYNANEDIDPIISTTDILTKQAENFENGKEYEERYQNMRRLTKIDNKVFKRDRKTGEVISIQEVELSREELTFLYEIDSAIQGFGFDKDPRIEELRSQRNIEEDILVIFDCEPDQIVHSQAELEKTIKQKKK